MKLSKARGLTLIELLIAAGLVAVVGLAVAALSINQQKIFRANERLQVLNDHSRLAMEMISRSIHNAGAGMDPNLAFDFQYYKCAGFGGGVNTSACTTPARNGGTNGPDELVLYYRDMNYQVPLGASGSVSGNAWNINTATSSAITLTGGAFDFKKGQVLQIVCAPNGTTYTYVTVNANVNSGSIALDNTGGDAFHQGAAITAGSCLASSNAYVYKINRERYYIQAFNGRPYLMLDQGIDLNGDGTLDAKDVIPVAEDIEDLQVAYQFTPDPGASGRATVGAVDASGNGDNVLWDVAGEESIAAPQDGTQTPPCNNIGISYYAQRCFFERTVLDALRFGSNPANISGVRVALIARSENPDQAHAGDATTKILPAVFDRAAIDLSTAAVSSTAYTNWYNGTASRRLGYLRSVIRFGSTTPNLQARGIFLW